MKKRLKTFAWFLFIGLLYLKYPMYADSVFPDSLNDEVQIPDFSDGAVRLDDALEWNASYLSGKTEVEFYEEFFSGKSVPMLTKKEQTYFAVIDENEDYAYKIRPTIPYLSNDKPWIYLQSCITYDCISLTSPAEKVYEFVESERLLRQKIREKTAYLLEHLDETEYGGTDYDISDGKDSLKVIVYLINEARRAELEAEGFVCESTLYSLAEQYQAAEKLYSQKELGIIYIDISPKQELIIYGKDTKEIFHENIHGFEPDIPYKYAQARWGAFGIYEYYEEEYMYTPEEEKSRFLQCAELDLDKPEEFIEYLRISDNITGENAMEEEKWGALQNAIQEWKQVYPDYSCKNIYRHVAGDYNAGAYMNFDAELLEFVDTLPAYEADKNAVLEDMYGDPQRLELKRLLREYKEIFPEMSYKTIYEDYIKEIEEDQLRSKEEKLYRYLWRKYSKELHNQNIRFNKEENAIKTPAHDFILDNSVFLLLDDIYRLNDLYLKNPNLPQNKVDAVIYKWIQKYMKTDGNIYFSYIDVFGNDGFIDYYCTRSDTSSISGDSMLLYSWWTGEKIALNKPAEEIKRFVGHTEQIAKQAREKFFFVRKNLKADEYSSVYIDYNRSVHVLLADKSKASMLEDAGILWEKAEGTREQIRERLKYLWKEHERLEISDVRVYEDEEIIIILGYASKEEFYKRLGEESSQKEIYIQINEYNTLEEFLEQKGERYLINESQKSSVEQCIRKLTEKYPEYSFENLFSLAVWDIDSDNYIDIDSEILKFVDNLTYYENEENPFDEQMYGDSRKLLLKKLLQTYKNLYPKKSCRELYDSYAKEIAESEFLSQKEKRSRYLWKIINAENEEPEVNKTNENSVYPAAAGSCMLIAGCISVIAIKNRAERRQKNL